MPTVFTMKPNRSGSRIVLIDLLRGLCLLVMTVDHLPETLIKKFTLQGFGFSPPQNASYSCRGWLPAGFMAG